MFLNEMPFTASGKIDRLSLKQLAEARLTGDQQTDNT
jgi:acyl-coenzyme A synthetase/AMP-(fatty) acid ligase